LKPRKLPENAHAVPTDGSPTTPAPLLSEGRDRVHYADAPCPGCLVPGFRDAVLGAENALAVCPAGIKDHGFLANLYLAVLETAHAFVNVQNRAGCVQLCVDKAKTARDRAFPEQTLTGPKSDGKLPNT